MPLLFLDPQSLLLFDVPLFLLLFGAIFLVARLAFHVQDPVANTAVAAVAGGGAFIAVRSQFEIQQWIWFHPQLFWGLFVLVFILMVVYWMIRA